MRRYSETLERSTNFERDLRSLIAEDFRFLETDFGLIPRALKDGYAYDGKESVVFVRMWEEAWVGVDRIRQPIGQANFGLPIWAVMNVRNSKYLYNNANNSFDKFPVYAAALLECCADFLTGDFSNVQPILDWLRLRDAKDKLWEERVLGAHRDDA
jgi:hypothetical protein